MNNTDGEAPHEGGTGTSGMIAIMRHDADRRLQHPLEIVNLKMILE